MLSFLFVIFHLTKSAQITGWIYADNWFELYFNGQKVATDPLVFYPHNAVYIDFTAPDDGLYSFAVWTQDFANDTTGLEPRQSKDGSFGGWCIGDGGIRISLSDGTVSNSNWQCTVVMEGPTNTGCDNNGECLSGGTKPTACTTTYNPYPSCWNETICDQVTTANGWVSATEYADSDVGWGRPPDATGYGYTYPDICGTDPIYTTEGCKPSTKFSNDNSKFIWTSDLNFHNRIICRYSYCVGGGTDCYATVTTTPSSSPTHTLTNLPSGAPLRSPTSYPSHTLKPLNTATPSMSPVASPTTAEGAATDRPSMSPDAAPSASPIVSPSRSPLAADETYTPSVSPIASPTTKEGVVEDNLPEPSMVPTTANYTMTPSLDANDNSDGSERGINYRWNCVLYGVSILMVIAWTIN